MKDPSFPEMSMKPPLVLLAALYLAQGVPFGFVHIACAGIFAERGYSANAISSMIALATLPWSFKWVWALLVDRYRFTRFGLKRSWVFGSQLLASLATLGLIRFPESEDAVSLFGVALLIQNVFLSLQDVSTDAFAVETLSIHEQGIANALMLASQQAGIILGGAGLNWVFSKYGFQAANAVQLLFLLLVTLSVWLSSSRQGHDQARDLNNDSNQRTFRAIFLGVLMDGIPIKMKAFFAGLAVVVAFGSALFSTLWSVFFIQKLGWTRDQYVHLTGGWLLVASLGSGILAGWIADRVGPRRIAVVAALGIAGLVVLLASQEGLWSLRLFPISITIAHSIVASAFGVSIFAIFMAASSKRLAATEFTAYMALLNVGGTIGAKLSAPLQATLDWSALFFLVAGVYAVLALVLLTLLKLEVKDSGV